MGAMLYFTCVNYYMALSRVLNERKNKAIIDNFLKKRRQMSLA